MLQTITSVEETSNLTTKGKLLTAEGLSEAISLPVYTIRQYTRERRIPAYIIGKHYLYNLDAVISSFESTIKLH